MTERTFTATELAETASRLRRLLEGIEAGEGVTADSGTVARMEGAVAALEALAGGRDATDDYA